MSVTPTPEFLDFQAVVAGRYSLERELGRGGMGIVFLAREVALDRLVALKLLPPALAAQPSLRERFVREARTAAQLSHPNIVPIFAVESVEGFVFFAMAFIEGETLGDRVRGKGPVTPAESARILRELAWALGYAHAQDVIHRDLKPDNIILESGSGRAVLTDFGIARQISATGVGDGELLGTPEFMSPEQATGDFTDQRSDLYALGVVGFFMLTGRVPFEGESIATVLVKHANEAAPSVAELAPGAPRALTQAIMRCLEKQPAARFANAREFADAMAITLEVRREIPPPVRLFLKKIEVGAGGCLYIFVVISVTPGVAVLADGLGHFFAPLLVISFAVITLGTLPAVVFMSRLRRMIKSGYRREDLLEAIAETRRHREEELAILAGHERTVIEKLSAVLRWPALILGGLAGVVGVIVLHQAFAVGIAIGLVGLLAWLVATSVMQRRRDRGSVRRERFWQSRFGKWLFKIASRGIDSAASTGRLTQRATELAIAIAAEDLYRELPKETQDSLSELPELVKRLEEIATGARTRIEQLGRGIGDAQHDRTRGVVAEEREKLLEDLTAARIQEQGRLSEAVAALEKIRLDLLRLRIGTGDVGRITLDLQRAVEIGDRMRFAAEGWEEVNQATRDKSKQDDQ